MALENAPQQQLRVDPAMFVGGNNAPVVEPSAVSAMAEGVRRGVITADEVLAHKQARDLAATQLDPAVVEARKRDAIAGAQQAEAQAALTQIQLQAAQLAAQMPAQIREMQTELAKNNYQVIPAAANVWTPADSQEVVRRWGVTKKFEAETGRAAAELSLIDPNGVDITTPRGKERVSVIKGSQQPVQPGQVQSLQQFLTQYRQPKDFDAAGQPAAPSLFGTVAPGTAQTAPKGPNLPPFVPNEFPAPAPSSAPGGNEQPVPLQPQAASAPSRAAMMGAVPQPAQPAASAGAAVVEPNAQPHGLLIEPVGLKPKAPTEQQGRALAAASRYASADQVLQRLGQKNFNPAQFSNWAQKYLVGPLSAFKTADNQSYEAAKNDWITGLLRLESGAAISSKEQSWYERTFFPSDLNEAPEVQAQKADLRDSIEQVALKLAQSGSLDVGALKQTLDQAGSLGGQTGATPQGGGTSQTVQTKSLGNVLISYGPDGQPRFTVQGQGTGGGGYTQPDRIVIEPKKK